MQIKELLRILARSIRAHWVHKCCWIIVLAIHLPAAVAGHRALWGGDSGSVEPAAFVILNLSVLFFVLKSCGVRWLDFSTSRRSLLTAVLAIMLMHARLGDETQLALVPPFAQEILAGALFAASLVQVQRLGQRLLPRVRDRRPTLAGAWRRHGADVVTLLRRADRLVIPRAPPLAPSVQ